MLIRKDGFTILHNNPTYLVINLKNTTVYLSIEPNEAVLRCKYETSNTGIKDLSDFALSLRLARLHSSGTSLSCMFTTRYVYAQMSPFLISISSHDYLKRRYKWLDMQNSYVKITRRNREQEEMVLVDLAKEGIVRVARKLSIVQHDRAIVPLSAESTRYQTQVTLPETDKRKRLTLPKTLCQKTELDIYG